jgi:tetratricopeptide (TPR) repeat protein/DNA-binding SARP family transcriptional activator/DNA-binding XRE family transcriptional regulator
VVPARQPAGFGGLLRSYRLRAGLSQEELSARSGVGVRTLRDLEQGRVVRPRTGSMERLAAALALSAADHGRLRAAAGVLWPADATGGRFWIGVLGPLVVRRGGAAVDVGAAGPQCLIGLLALQAGQVVSREEIVDVLWPTSPPKGYLNQIQVYVGRLRRLLEPEGAKRTGFQVLVRVGEGYRLNLTGDDLDLLQFDDLAARAGQAGADGHTGMAEQLLEQASACWRGPVLGGAEPRLAQHPAAVAAASRRVDAALAFADAAGTGADPRKAVGPLRAVAADEPLHEGLHARLMLALAATGQQAAALEVFQAIRDRLDEDLGIQPGAELRAAHLRVLRQQVTTVAPVPDPPGPGRGGPPSGVTEVRERGRPAQLPADVAGFTGRTWHVQQLDRLVAGQTPEPVAIVVIDGTAGVGKTALAVHWAHRVSDRFPDGQLHVDLRGYAVGAPLRPIDALDGFLRALGVPAERVPVHPDEAAAMYRSLLARRRVLVVLDNARDAEQVRPLLPGAPGSHVVVTSRARLAGLVARDGATRLTLDVLTDAEARALLERLLGRERVAAEPEATIDLARACAHLPLALRIAAANLLDRPGATIADHLAELTSGDRLTALAVHGDEQTAVRAAFDLSYTRLDAPTRRLFRLLGPVPGPDVTVEAAAALADVPPGRAKQLLTLLTVAHLLDQPAPGRYASHDLLRLYAGERAAAEDSDADRQAALRRLYDHYQHSVDAAAGLLYPQRLRLPPMAIPAGSPSPAFADHARALAWLDAEQPNLLATITHTARHGPHPVAWRLADALRGYLSFRAHAVDWLTVARAAEAAAVTAADPMAQAAAHLNLSTYHLYQSHHRQAIEHSIRMLALADRSGWVDGQGAALTNLGALYHMSGQLAQAADHFARALTIDRRLGDVAGEAVDLNWLGIVWWHRGRLEQAVDHHTRALRLFEQVGSHSGQANTLADLGVAHHLLGHLERAADDLTRALALHRQIGDRTDETETLNRLAEVYADVGRHHEAVDLAGTALALARDTDNRIDETEAFIASATAYHRLGDHRRAADHYRQALRSARDAGHRYPETRALAGLAGTLVELDEPRPALARAQHALTLARAAQFRLLEGQILTAFAAIDHRLGDHHGAVHHAHEALAVHAETGHRLGAARTHRVLDHILDSAGRPGDAEAHRRRAHWLFVGMGIPDVDEFHLLPAAPVPTAPGPSDHGGYGPEPR